MAGSRDLALTGDSRVRAPRRPELLRSLAGLLGVVLLGVPVGLLWSALAPRPDVVATADGGIQFVDAETKDFITADAYLFLLGLAAGSLAAVLVWRLVRRRGLGTLVGLVVAAGLAAWVASRIGHLGGDRRALLAAARAGRLTRPADLPLQLHARAVLLAWPAAASLTYAALLWRQPAQHRSAPSALAGPGLDEPPGSGVDSG